MSEPLLPGLPVILDRVRAAEHVCLALDFDGTLAPVAETPEQAAMPVKTAEIVRELSATEHVSTIILSGRSLSDLKSRVNLDCIYAGTHGLEIQGEGISFLPGDAGLFRHAVDLACWDLEAALQAVRGVFVERKGLSATVHYRCAPSDLRQWIETTVRLAARPYTATLQVRKARKAWDIHPRSNWNKGSAVREVLRHIGAPEPLLICAGDDAADEDMFHIVPDAISIQVGARPGSSARYRVDGPNRLAAFLGELRAALRSRAVASRAVAITSIAPQALSSQSDG